MRKDLDFDIQCNPNLISGFRNLISLIPGQESPPLRFDQDRGKVPPRDEGEIRGKLKLFNRAKVFGPYTFAVEGAKGRKTVKQEPP